MESEIKDSRRDAEAQSIGNAAKLREALVGLIDGICFHCDMSEDCKGVPCEKMQKAKAALAEPPRNCDVGTAGEQKERFSKFCTEHTDPMDIDGWQCDKKCPLYKNHPDCQFAWAQMPYESEVSHGKGMLNGYLNEKIEREKAKGLFAITRAIDDLAKAIIQANRERLEALKESEEAEDEMLG